MKIVYFYAKDGKKIGPLSRGQLNDLHLTPDTLVWHYGLTGWIPYKNLPKPVAKQDESSPFDTLRAWIKSKKKESAPKAEVKPVPVVETIKEELVVTTMSEVAAEPIVKPAIDSETIAQKEQQQAVRREKVRRGWKKFLKIFLIIIASLCILAGCILAFGYIKYEYLPEKRLKEACAELEAKWNEVQGQDKVDMAIRIMSKNTSWGYDNVPNSKINESFGAPRRKSALKVIENDAFRGNVESQFRMGQIYCHEDRYYMDADYTKAAYWWNEAAQNGNMAAMNNLGWAYQNGNGVKKNMQKAIECYKIAAAANKDYAINNLAYLYESGVTVVSGYHYEQYSTFNDYPQYPDDIFVRSGWQGYDHYNVYRHKVTDYKTILQKDIKKARELWRKAAALGNEDAKEQLQRIFE